MTMAEQHGKPWIKRDDDYLRWHWGEQTPDRIARILGRTTVAVVARVSRIKLRGPSCGGESVKGLAKRTGYDPRTILRVAKKIGLNIRYTPSFYLKKDKKYRWSRLSEEQVGKILGYLATGRSTRRAVVGEWGGPMNGGGTKLPCCRVCERTDRPHYAMGCCKRCTLRVARAKKMEANGGRS